jgi:hypothetical protein
MALGFVLASQPEQCPRVVALLSESYNAHVRCVRCPFRTAVPPLAACNRNLRRSLAHAAGGAAGLGLPGTAPALRRGLPPAGGLQHCAL